VSVVFGRGGGGEGKIGSWGGVVGWTIGTGKEGDCNVSHKNKVLGFDSVGEGRRVKKEQAFKRSY